MNRLLEELTAASRVRPIAAASGDSSIETGPSLAAALRGRARLSLLAEFKRCSPSAPALAREVDLRPQIAGYVAGGAAGLSILTEPTRFGGSLDDLRQARAACELPILRKDFLVRPEQVQEARCAGASAVLLIVRCLPGGLLGEMVSACEGAGLEALVECHDESELERAVAFDHVLLGINNRDLDTLRIDRSNAARLARRLPEDRIVVAESGYENVDQLAELLGLVDAVLIGSALMRGGSAASFAEVRS
ncbi:MAG: indole-3-glycerol-phosphate synthase [Planctomycetota bacterium]